MAGLRTARVLVEQLSERSPDRVEAAEASLAQAAERGTDPTDALVADGHVTSLDVARAIAGEWGLDVVELARGEADPVAMRELPLALSRRHGVVVIAADADSVTLATTDPGDIVAIDDVRAATGRAANRSCPRPARARAAGCGSAPGTTCRFCRTWRCVANARRAARRSRGAIRWSSWG